MTDKIHDGWEIIPVRAMESSITVYVWNAGFIPNSEVIGDGDAVDTLVGCARPRVQRGGIFSSHGTFSNGPPILHCCGRDDRTPPTQKFNIGVQV
jgi:hypothetical protein